MMVSRILPSRPSSIPPKSLLDEVNNGVVLLVLEKWKVGMGLSSCCAAV